MAVLIGHASIDENGKGAGGQAGDQTAKEVCTRNWYNKDWNVLIRCTDPEIAEKMAIAMEQACANKHIGYDQWNRNTLYAQLKKVGLDMSKVSVDCECDCSSLVSMCAICAGVSADILYAGGNMRTTRNMRTAFANTGKFQILTDSKYLTSDAYLQRGDILVKENSHTVLVLSNGAKADVSSGKIEPVAPIENKEYCGKGIGTATALDYMNVRTGPKTSYKIIGTVNKGAKVEVLERTSAGWYKIVWPGAGCGYAYVSNANNKYFSYVANASTGNSLPYIVRITASALNVRAGAGTTYKINTVVHKNEAYTIVEEKAGWGKLKSGAGWISLKYTKKV